ncbi:YrdB family protein [Amnibacterium sp.]|uniref:YrdB family protein n=1 Tax=Amnibacterium sp. TaxID=1872496 RepID=UPI002612C67A|nr:YrdB family protein [Amnibacterium sp.]MCU1474424.1 hypothetical protein [Amnibacterium sp.]
MRLAVLTNAVLALLTELGLLAAAIAIALLSPLPPAARIVLAVLLPSAVIAVWGVLLAPRSSRRVGARARLLTEAVLFALAAVGLSVVGAALPAVLLTVAAGARLILGAAIGRV